MITKPSLEIEHGMSRPKYMLKEEHHQAR